LKNNFVIASSILESRNKTSRFIKKQVTKK